MRGLGALLALASLLSVEGCEESFECAADSHCQRDGVEGFCESIGHCSFSDDGCDSGRRFGKGAGTLSNQCVPPPDGGSTSGEPMVGTTTSSPTATTSTTSSSSASPSSSEAGGSSSTSAAESTGTGPMLCRPLFEDRFDGDALDPGWTVVGTPTVSDGAVRFSIEPENIGGYDVITVEGGAPFDLRGGSVSIHTGEIPAVLRTQGTLTLHAGGTEVFALFESGALRTFVDGETIPDTAAGSAWLRIAFHPAGETTDVVFSESDDGRTWFDVATAAGTDVDASSVVVRLTAGAYEAFTIPQVFEVDTITVCGE